MNHPRARDIFLVVFIAALPILAACGRPDSSEPPLFNRTATLVQRLDSVGRSNTIYVLDREISTLVGVSSDGVTTDSLSIAPPPEGWPQTTIEAWLTDDEHITFVVPASNATLYRTQFSLVDATHDGWRRSEPVSGTVIINGQILDITSNTLLLGNTPITLPANANVLPKHLDLDGFAYLTSHETLAWWHPQTATSTWQLPVSTAHTFLTANQTAIAWAANGYVYTAHATEAAIRDIRRAPIEAGVVHLRFEDKATRTVLWAATADGSLHRLIPGAEAGQLCYVDGDSTGSVVSGIQLIDVGRISNPQLHVLRRDLDQCPGWLKNDIWAASYEAVPAPWQGVRLDNIANGHELEHGEWLAAGMTFLGSDGNRYDIATTSPLTFDGAAPGAVTGDIVPLDHWTFQSERLGFAGVIRPDEVLEVGALQVTVRTGDDREDRGDTFRFDTENGVTSFLGTTAIAPWEWFAGGRVAALDRKSNTVLVLDPETHEIIATLR